MPKLRTQCVITTSTLLIWLSHIFRVQLHSHRSFFLDDLMHRCTSIRRFVKAECGSIIQIFFVEFISFYGVFFFFPWRIFTIFNRCQFGVHDIHIIEGLYFLRTDIKVCRKFPALEQGEYIAVR